MFSAIPLGASSHPAMRNLLLSSSSSSSRQGQSWEDEMTEEELEGLGQRVQHAATEEPLEAARQQQDMQHIVTRHGRLLDMLEMFERMLTTLEDDMRSSTSLERLQKMMAALEKAGP
ncbi:hypothetical protein D9Q98_002663 [Chlorella vulgaris]|uniref:Uncharacterized protein n=1 Tax=Chlorella vulgaris TaxID=3077 RepID=A0A9D4TU75_CHLVU|nr:hypothetical protein D9Q98_002663 [Chlorella vulgaris]